MRLGMYLDMRNPPPWRKPWGRHYGQWLERIQEAERLGAPSVWLTEHHFFDDGYLPQCWTFAAAVAARTESIRIGSAVSLLPLHQAVELAEQIAVVDVISNGRAEPGFGVGYRAPEYEAFGGDYRRRYRVFADRIRELRALWGETDGTQRVVTPSPVQNPVPLWAGFGGPMGARLAGQLGLGLQSLDRDLLEPYMAGLTSGGHDQSAAHLAGQIEFFLSDDPERAWAQIEKHVMYRWDSYNRYMFEGTRLEGEPVGHFDPESIRSRFLIGTPGEVAEAIWARMDGLPVTDLFGWSDYPGLPDQVVDEQIRLTFTELAPLLTQERGSSD